MTMNHNPDLLTASQAPGPARFIQPDSLTASDDPDARELSGLVLPFDKPGRTSRGRLAVTASAVKLPEDLRRVKLYRDHSDVGGSPVGYATHAEIKPDGLYMSFRVGATPDGDAALTDVAEGIRDALSVELVSPQITGTKITAAQLSAVAIVATPAFEDARVSVAPARPSVAAQIAAGNRITASQDTDVITLTSASATIAAAASGNGGMVTAALGELTEAGHSETVEPVEWLGELWSGGDHQRKFWDTLTTKNLVRGTLRGWRWTTRPEVDTYAGNLAEIPSNTPATEPVEVSATRLAGGHKIDRKFIDFGDTEFIASYLRAMRDSYSRKSDARALTAIVTAANSVYDSGNDQPGLLQAAALANTLMEENERQMSVTTFLVNSRDRLDLIELTRDKAPEYLDMLGINPAAFVSAPGVPRGRLIAYDKNFMLAGELAGSPIRVNALDVARGGSDEALFGYTAFLTQDTAGIKSVGFTTGL